MGQDPSSVLGVTYNEDAYSCDTSCVNTPGCISYVLFDFYGLCGLFSVPVSEIAGGTGQYTFWDIAVRISHAFLILRTRSHIKYDYKPMFTADST